MPLVSHASTITDLISVNASAASGQVVDLEFSLAWDPTQNVFTPTSDGLSLLSATNTDPLYAAAYQPQPLAWDYFFAPNGSLNLSTTTDPSATGQYGLKGGIEGFALDFDDLSTSTPHLVTFWEATPSLLYLTSLSGTVTVSPQLTPASVTPEPSSLALLGTGLAGLVRVMRRRDA